MAESSKARKGEGRVCDLDELLKKLKRCGDELLALGRGEFGRWLAVKWLGPLEKLKKLKKAGVTAEAGITAGLTGKQNSTAKGSAASSGEDRRAQ